MIIIDGTDTTMGRIASYAAKEALKGEEIIVINCNKVLISGSREFVERDFLVRRGRYGSSHKGPIISKSNERIVKRTIRGMLPNFREGRGKDAYNRLRCYNEVPKEYESQKKIKLVKGNPKKTIKLELLRK